MKIAATYENGNIFQHFGRTEQFKIYEIEDGKVVSSQVIGNDGLGHGALAGLLADHAIDVLICGGLGAGAQNALASAGVEVVAGASGSADEAVEAYLKGELVSTGANCDHHHGEDHTCGDHGCGHHDEEEGGCCGHSGEEGGCGSEEGGCGGCCGGGPRLLFEGPNAGKTVRVHYEGTLNDGSKFDSSYDRGEPLEFICGAGMMIEGFDKAVVDMEPGEVRNIHLMPEEAYGQPDPAAIFTIRFEQLPGSEALEVGEHIHITNSFGAPFPVVVKAKDESTITFDANHEMAGKELNFKVELVEVL
ncbi:MAG: FKBP-type peptidyl-prolyl cis-trans isomerase [Stomatobaculum sp.]|nr:FKBP-type peptidyl-prolyl cis-trans isomerase [Stomatobaculum sp.]